MNTTTNMRFNRFKRLKHSDVGANEEFIESLIVEQNEEATDYNHYN